VSAANHFHWKSFHSCIVLSYLILYPRVYDVKVTGTKYFIG